MFEKAASIQGCMSSGNVEVIASENTSMVLVGGFIGNGAEDPILTVANSYSTGDVTAGNGTYVMCGGFIGYGAPTVQNCYSLSNVTSKNGALYAWAFGFSGWTVSGANFTNCYALGASMDGGTHTASFLNGTPTMNNCFYYEGMELNGTNVSNTTVIALSEDEIMGETAFSEFDSSVWQLSAGNLPILEGIPDRVEKTDKPVYLRKQSPSMPRAVRPLTASRSPKMERSPNLLTPQRKASFSTAGTGKPHAQQSGILKVIQLKRTRSCMLNGKLSHIQ